MDCLHEPPPRLVSWRRDRRNSRVGFAAVEIQTSHGPLTISNIIVSQNCGSRFVAMPAGAFIANGQAAYTAILKWTSIARFRTDVIALVERADPGAFDDDAGGVAA